MTITEKIINNEKIQFLNFICTSKSDYHQLDRSKWKKAKIFNWLYLSIIFVSILISFIPLFFISNENENKIMSSLLMASLNVFVLIILCIDYFFRWITYPIRIQGKSINPLFFFIFTSSSIMILASISSAILFVLVSFLPNNTQLLKMAKALSILKIFRFILLLNIIPSFKILTEVFIRNRNIVFNLLLIVFSLVFIFALIIYSIEYSQNPLIKNYGDALYYSFITIATVGFGDVYCITSEGRFLSVILGILGSIVFAIPFGIVVGAFNVKITEKYKDLDQSDIYAITTLFEKAYLKVFNKKDNFSCEIIFNKSWDENSDIYKKIIEILGDQENIIRIDKKENKTIVILKNSKKINNNKLNLIINAFDIKIKFSKYISN